MPGHDHHGHDGHDHNHNQNHGNSSSSRNNNGGLPLAVKVTRKERKLLSFIMICFFFFCLEIGSGYYTGSVALIADSFHMLSDVASLFIALYAARLAKRSRSNVAIEFSFGLQRAEILGALINGISLLALSFTLILEAIQRFFVPTHIDQPWIVFGVGSAGLIVNVVGLALFHEHSHHSHGDSHSHSHGAHVNIHDDHHGAHTTTEQLVQVDEEDDRLHHTAHPFQHHAGHIQGNGSSSSRHSPVPRRNDEILSSSPDNNTAAAILENPIQLGEKVIRAAALLHERSESMEEQLHLEDLRSEHHQQQQYQSHGGRQGSGNVIISIGGGGGGASSSAGGYSKNDRHHSEDLHHHDHDHHDHNDDHDHDHEMEAPGASGSHGHSHGDMNMHGIFLHVMGDLLASLGVITTSLVLIFVKNEPWIEYLDPITSLFITGIIITSTLPLVRSACYILLQRTPPSVSVEALRRDIMQIPGILSVHELHVWQLSESQTIASVHVVVPRPEGVESVGGLLMEQRYMLLAAAIKKKLHSHGVHSTTVQPEFLPEYDSDGNNMDTSSSSTCMLRCTSKNCETYTCCPSDSS